MVHVPMMFLDTTPHHRTPQQNPTAHHLSLLTVRDCVREEAIGLDRCNTAASGSVGVL